MVTKMKVYYYGWAGYQNFGDDMLKHIILNDFGFEHDENSKTLMIGGGTILPIHPNHQLYNIMKLDKKRFDNIIVVGTGHSYKPETNNYNEETNFTKTFLKDSKFIGLRDEESKTYMDEYLSSSTVIGDPFYSFNPEKFISQNVSLEQLKPYVVIQLGNEVGRVYGGVDADLDYVKETIKFIKEFVIGKLGLKVCFLPLHIRDQFMNEFGAAAIKKENSIVCRDYLNPTAVFTIIANAEFMISYRQHGLIGGLILNTPTIPIVYREKTFNIAKEFGLEKLTIKTSEVTKDELIKRYELLKSNWNTVKIRHKLDDYKQKTSDFVNKIKLELNK